MTASKPVAPTHTPSYFPQVSVIVPIYNGEQDLPGLLNCLLAQTYPAQKVEYLLVDNGSSDRTPQILAEAAPHLCRSRNHVQSPSRNRHSKRLRGSQHGHLPSYWRVFGFYRRRLLPTAPLAHRLDATLSRRHCGPSGG